MAERIQAISWEAPEHRHIEKTTDWYWGLGIVAITACVVSIIFGDLLFGLVILLAATTMVIVARRPPRTVHYEISPRGVRVQNTFYPFASFEAYYLDETNTVDPQAIFKSRHFFMPLIIIPVPISEVDAIEDMISERVPEEELVEPLAHRLLEFFGF